MLKDRRVRLGLLALAGWLLVVVAGWALWILPIQVREMVAGKADEALGQTLQVQRIGINPFRLRVRLEGVTLNWGESGTPIAAVRRIEVNAGLKTLFTEGLRLDVVAVEELHLQARRNSDGSIDLMDLIPESEEKEDKESLALRLGEARLSGISVRFDDDMVGVTHVVRNLAVKTGKLSTRPADAADKVALTISAAGVNRAPVALTVSATPFAQPIDLAADGTIDAVDVTHYLPYVKLPAGLEIVSAKLALALSKVEARLGGSGEPELTIDGAVELTDLRCDEAGEGQMLEIPKVALTLVQTRPLAGDLHVGRLAVTEPKVWVKRAADETLNLMRAAAMEQAAGENEEESSAKGAGDEKAPLRLRVDEFDLQKLVAIVDDVAVANQFNTKVGPVTMRIEGIDTDSEETGTIELSGSSRHCERFEVTGTFALVRPTLDLRIQAGPMTIAGYSPYYRDLTKIDVADGTLEVAADARLQLEPEFSLTVTNASASLNNLMLKAREGGRELASIPKFEVKGGRLSMSERLASVETVSLTKAVVHAKRLENGDLDWLTLLPKSPTEGQQAEAPNEQSSKKVEEAPYRVSVQSLEIAEFAAVVRDEAVEPAFATKLTVDLEGTDISTAPGSRANFDVTVNEAGGVKLLVDASVEPQPLSVEALVRLSGLEPRRFAAYYDDAINFEVVSGTVDADATFWVPKAGVGQAVIKKSELKVTELALQAKGKEKPFLSLESLTVNASVDAGKQTATGAAILKGGFVNIVRGADGAIDLAAILAPVKTDKAATGPSEKSEVAGEKTTAQWQATIGRFDLSAFDVGFRDETTPTPVELALQDLSFRVDGLGTAAEAPPAKLELNTRLASGGTIFIAGDVEPAAKKVALATKLEKVGVQAFEPYLRNQLNVLLKGGTLLMTGQLEADASGEKPVISWAGDIGVAEFAMIDPTNAEPLVQWDNFGVTGIELGTEPLRLAIEEVRADKPVIRLAVNADGKLNLTELMKSEQVSKEASADGVEESAEAPAELPSVTVKKVAVVGGEVGFLDEMISPSVSHQISELNLTLENLSLQDQGLAALEVKASLGSQAKLTVRGEMRPHPFFLDAKVDLIGFQLPAMSPYSGKFIGWEMAQGQLMLDLKHRVDGTKLNLENTVVLDHFDLGGKVESKDAVKVPLKLALPLLRDLNDQISLPLPIKGDLKDPKFKISQIVIQTFVNLITKAAASPFSMLGSLVDTEQNLEEVTFEPGLTELSENAVASLKPLSEALTKRPALNLLVTGEIGDGDAEVIRLAKFEALLRGQKAKALIEAGELVEDTTAIEIEDGERAQLTVAVYQAAELPELPPLPELAPDAAEEDRVASAEARVAEVRAAVLATVAVEENDLVELATTRSEAVQGWLIEKGIAEERVFIGQMKTDATKDKKPKVRFAPK